MENSHKKLCSSLTELLKEAVDYQFHDFKNDKYATPKMALVGKLTTLTKEIMNGEYDD